MVSFDDFESFVEKGRRFDQNFWAHFPIWVFEGFFGGYFGELFSGFAEKRTAGTGESDAGDVFW